MASKCGRNYDPSTNSRSTEPGVGRNCATSTTAANCNNSVVGSDKLCAWCAPGAAGETSTECGQGVTQNCDVRWIPGYGICDATCKQYQYGLIDIEPTSTGTQCPTPNSSGYIPGTTNVEYQREQACVYGTAGVCASCAWKPWTACGADCTQTRDPVRSGCAAQESRACYSGGCNMDCQVTAWNAPSACGADCQQTTTSSAIIGPFGTGAACTPSDLTVTNPCIGGSCNQACEVSWNAWTGCQPDCKQSRTGIITKQPSGGGSKCPNLTQKNHCTGGDCRCRTETTFTLPEPEFTVTVSPPPPSSC